MVTKDNERNFFAYIENDRSTTVGVHLYCESRRFVAGTSVYVCGCSSAHVEEVRNADRTTYTAPHPLPAV